MTGQPGFSGYFDGVRNVRWIAFDAVGTLIDPDPPAAAVYHRVARKHGSRLTEQEISGRFIEAFQQSESEDLRPWQTWSDGDALLTSEIRERDRWRTIVFQVLHDVDHPEPCFKELHAHFAQPAAWACFPDVGDALSMLKSQGYRLALASNFDDRLNAICDALPELRPIERRTISSLAGYRKPSLQFYRALVKAAGCQPQEMLMVGDDWENDILGAGRAGLNALPIRRAPLLQRAPPAPNGREERREEITDLRQLAERLKA